MLDNFLIDKTSYWIGFIAGLLALIAIKNGQPISGMFKEIIKQRFSMLRRGLSTSTEHRYRQDILKIFQTNHLAAPLFSLMEISMGARLLSPPLPVVPNGDVAQDNLTSLTIPYMPDWPEVGAIFGADTISFQEALSRGRNLLVMGKPGSGKTFALSQLVMQIAKRDTGLGEIRNLVPVMVHVGDLNVQATRKKLTDVLYLALAEKVSTLVEAQLSGFFESIFEAGLAMLIVDGMDELSPESQKPYIEFIKEIQEAYPDIRLIVATSTEFFAAVDVLDLYPMAMAAWRPGQSEEFFTRWGQLWEKHIASESWSKKLPNLADPVILKGWLGDNLVGDSPFMQTLKVWGLFAGDLSGLDSPDVIEAYINRMSVNVKNARPAMEHLAVQMVLNESPLTTRKSAGAFISTFEENDETETGIEPVAVESTPSKPLSEDDFESLLDDLDNLDQAQIPEEVETDEQTIEPNSHIGIGNKNVRRMLPELAETRLMTYYPNGKIGFQHQIVSGYLAGRGLAVRGVAELLTSQPPWNGKTLAWAFLGSDVDISNLTESLSQNDKLDPLRRGLLAMGRWPRHAEKTATWRSNILRRLAGVLQYESLSMGLRARVLASLAFSGEKGMGSLFQQLMQSPQTSVIMLGIMGCGLTQYENVVTEVANFLYHPSIQVSQTACLALVAMNTTPALEYVAEALLHGDEKIRRAAAEALAKHKKEGYPVLKEGAELEDILVRRAVVFGLARVHEPWAKELLEKIQIDDSEWVVRNAAGQTLDDLQKGSSAIPSILPGLHETPWLITFASEKGVGIAEGQSSWDMLEKAIKEGSEEQKLSAMEIYRQKPTKAKSVLAELYEMTNGLDEEIREAAYNTIWHIGGSGIELPPMN